MLGPYFDVLKLDGSWKFSLAGLILRPPMSMIFISIVLLIKVSYGNYSPAGLTAALNVIVTALCAPIIARYVDRLGQRKAMGPPLTIKVATSIAFLLVVTIHASPVLVALITVIVGVTWGASGAFVRVRWTNTLKDQPKGLTIAFTLESVTDEFVYILGLALSTILGTLFHPDVGLVLICLFLGIGGFWFFLQSASESAPRPKAEGERRQLVLRDPVVVVMILTYIAAGSMFDANDVAAVAFTAVLGVPPISGILLVFLSIGSLFTDPWYDSRRWTQPLWGPLVFDVVPLATGTSIYLLAHSIPVMALVMTLTGITCTPTMMNVNTVVTRIVAPERLAESLTWVGTSLNIGLPLGSVMMGPVVDVGGARSDRFVMVSAAWVTVTIMVLGLPSLCRAVTSLHPRIEE